MLCYNCMRDKGDSAVCPHCNTQDVSGVQPHHLRPGYVVGNRYTLGRVLGEGGFGITYIGRSNTLEINVAVKEYYPCGYCNRNTTAGAAVLVTSDDRRSFYEQGRSRFLKEAKTLAKFQNEPGIVNVIDYIEENNTAYIVMEYLDGINLRQYLKQNGAVSPVRAIQMLMPMMQALAKVHAAGVIHRDISPDNIMILRDGSLKLMDFGAARDFDGDNRSMSVMLKQGYAPEEQYRRNGEQGPWTDVYGVCATLYRMITGSAPEEALDRVRQDTLKPPSACGVAIAPALENAIMYGLAVYKDNRCPDMGTLISLLNRVLGGEMTMFADLPQDQTLVGEGATMFADLPQPETSARGSSRQTTSPGGYTPPSASRYQPKPDAYARSNSRQTTAPGGYPPQPAGGYRQPPMRQYVSSAQDKSPSNAPIIAAICFAAVVIVAAVIVVIAVLNRGNSDTRGNSADNSSSAVTVDNDIAEETNAAVVMPDLVGESKQDAIDKLADLNLSVAEFIETESDEQSPGKVFNQVPKKDSDVNGNTKITLYIAKAKPTTAPTQKPTEKPAEQPNGSGSSGSYLYCTADTYVTVHQSADINSKPLRKVWRGQAVKYISSSSNWYYVEAGGTKGYAYASYLSASSNDIPYQNSSIIYVNSNVDFLALRESPSENGVELTRIPPNASLTFLNKVGDNGGVRDDGYHVQWAYVQYGNLYGYVYDYYVHD